MDPGYVVSTLWHRRMQQSPWIRTAEQVLACYEGNLRLPNAELDEVEENMVANLIVQGIDQTGMRVASVKPQTRFFPEKPGQHASEQRARTRAAMFKGVHNHNAMNLLDRKRARWLVAFAKSPVLIRPLDGAVTWEARDPLSCFPAPSADPDAMMADNCVFSIERPFWWLEKRWPEKARMLRRPKNMASSESVTIVEYVDGDTWGMYVAAPGDAAMGRVTERNYGHSYSGGATPGIDHSGPTMMGGPSESWIGTEDAITLVEDDNRSGLCPVVMPQRITLGALQGQFDQMVGVYKQQAKLAALEYTAIVESVFPPVYAVQAPGEQMEVVKAADSRRGIMGEIRGGTLQPLQLNPGFQVFPQQDRLERAQRLNGGIPSDYGGESGNNIRTARRGDQVLSGVVDFPIQEAQELMERSRWHENMCAIAVGKGWFGAKQFSFGASWRGRGKATWTFNDLFPTPDSMAHEVKFAYAGADANGQIIRQGQKLGLGLISKQSVREDDPEIDDPELEKDRIDAEALEDALRSGIQQQVAGGTMDPAMVAKMIGYIKSDRLDLIEAYERVNEEAKAIQAQQQATAAEQAPGLAGPEAAVVPGGTGGPGGPPALLAGLTRDLGALRLAQNSTPQEARAEAAVGAR